MFLPGGGGAEGGQAFGAALRGVHQLDAPGVVVWGGVGAAESDGRNRQVAGESLLNVAELGVFPTAGRGRGPGRRHGGWVPGPGGESGWCPRAETPGSGAGDRGGSVHALAIRLTGTAVSSAWWPMAGGALEMWLGIGQPHV